jgi:Short C-terminal domain
MRRRAMVRRGPGVVGTMARTAVVAGTATVTAKAVSGGMDSRAAAQQQQEAINASAMQNQTDMQQMQTDMQQMQGQLAQQQAPQPPMPAAAAPTAHGTDLTSQLQQLAQLKQSGVLSDEEFQFAKAKLLGS